MRTMKAFTAVVLMTLLAGCRFPLFDPPVIGTWSIQSVCGFETSDFFYAQIDFFSMTFNRDNTATAIVHFGGRGRQHEEQSEFIWKYDGNSRLLTLVQTSGGGNGVQGEKYILVFDDLFKTKMTMLNAECPEGLKLVLAN